MLILYIESKLGLHEVRVLSDEGTGFAHIAVVRLAFFTVFVVNICCDALVYGHVLLWKIVVVFVIAVEMAHFPLEYLCTHIAFCSAYGQIDVIVMEAYRFWNGKFIFK